MTTQPEPLRLAESISQMDTFTEHQRGEILKAAAELRRLHEVEQAHNTLLAKVYTDNTQQRITALEALNAELLEALESMMRYVEPDCGDPVCPECKHWRPIWSAIAKAEGETK